MNDSSGGAIGACDQMNPETLAAWVDEALSSPEAWEAVAAHVAACSGCANRAAELRAQKQRLAAFRTATTPGALPDGFWERARAGMDRIDAQRRPARAAPSQAVRPGPRALRLAATLALAMLAALALALWPRARPIVPVESVARLPLMGPPPAGSVTLVTNDADRAAAWLSDQLGTRIPTVNLSLVGAGMIGARADRAAQQGMLLYRGARGTPVALYLFVDPRTALPPLPPVTFNGSTYRIVENTPPRVTLVAWQADGRTFVAAAPLPAAGLLPYAREMDRHCRRRP